MKLIIACIIAMIPVIVIFYAVIAENIKEKREKKEKGIVAVVKPKYTYSFWSVISGIIIAIPVMIYELFIKRTKRY
ncbi:MAG: hypothetical protein ABW174_16605 [Flavitalea sp.]